MITPEQIEMCIPIQALDINKIHIGPLQTTDVITKNGIRDLRRIAPLSYQDGSIRMNILNILMPTSTITKWDPTTGRLELDFIQTSSDVTTSPEVGDSKRNTISPEVSDSKRNTTSPEVVQVINKLISLQDYIIRTVFNQQQLWFGKETMSYEYIASLLQPIVKSKATGIILFLHGPVSNEFSRRTNGRTFIYSCPTWSRGTKFNSFNVGDQIRLSVKFHGLCLVPGMRFRLQHQIIGIIGV